MRAFEGDNKLINHGFQDNNLIGNQMSTSMTDKSPDVIPHFNNNSSKNKTVASWSSLVLEGDKGCIS